MGRKVLRVEGSASGVWAPFSPALLRSAELERLLGQTLLGQVPALSFISCMSLGKPASVPQTQVLLLSMEIVTRPQKQGRMKLRPRRKATGTAPRPWQAEAGQTRSFYCHYTLLRTTVQNLELTCRIGCMSRRLEWGPPGPLKNRFRIYKITQALAYFVIFTID